jgi:endogenous inhibitor of DNA gyrase (YacG/DUF329 family)
MKIVKEDIKPMCPYCSMPVDRLIQVKGGAFVTHRVFCCPHCRKIVGVSSNST